MGASSSHQVGNPTVKKEVTGELGCVTPYIVVPGEWSTSDLEYHAGAIATGKSHNAGHNCLAAEIIITAADWPQRQQFLDILRWALNLVINPVAQCIFREGQGAELQRDGVVYPPNCQVKFWAAIETFHDLEMDLIENLCPRTWIP